MKEIVDSLLRTAFESARAGGELTSPEPPLFVVEVPNDPTHGDLASNLALVLARPERRSPRQIAETLRKHLPETPDVTGVEIGGPGFLNFRFALPFWHARLQAVRTAGSGWECPPTAEPRKIQVEFVSANPTGPLTVGHGRNAVIGDTISRLLEARGHAVTREYYFNNMGRQMQVLGESVRARYLERLGREVVFPDGGYQGDYIRDVANALVDAHDSELAGCDDLTPFREAAEQAIFDNIRQTLDRIGIRFDVYFNEDSLYREGAIDDTLARLRKTGRVYEREGGVWLELSALGLAADKVLVKSSGEPAYRLPDIAYHENKLARGFDLVIDVLGADHIAEHEEVKAGLAALGHDVAKVRVVIYQFVTLLRAGQQVKMSTRRAEYVTLDGLLGEVGSDVARFFFLTRKSDTHLEFDLDLAKQRSMENPVYYVQYAHARISNILERALAEGHAEGAVSDLPLERLEKDDEIGLVRRVVSFPETVAEAADLLEPHRVTFFLIDLAAAFHSYYNHRENRVVSEDADLTRARLALVLAVRRVLKSGLELLGVDAPERM